MGHSSLNTGLLLLTEYLYTVLLLLLYKKNIRVLLPALTPPSQGSVRCHMT